MSYKQSERVAAETAGSSVEEYRDISMFAWRRTGAAMESDARRGPGLLAGTRTAVGSRSF